MFDQGRQIPAKLTIGFLIVGLLSTISVSCSYQPNQQLRIGTNSWPGYEPLYLARSLDYFQDHDIRLVELSSASQVMRAFRNGLIDAAALSLDETILLLSQGYQPRIVLVLDISDGADAIVSRPELDNISELSGKKIGVESSALGAYVLARALELNNLTADDVRIVPINIDKQLRSFQQGEVDALVTFEPVKTVLKSKLAGKVLFDSSQIPGEIVDVLVVRAQYLQQNPDAVNAAKIAWYRALDYFRQNTQAAVNIMAPRLGLMPAEALASYDGLMLPTKQESDQLLKRQSESTPELLDTAIKLHKTMLKQGLKAGMLDLSVLFPPM